MYHPPQRWFDLVVSVFKKSVGGDHMGNEYYLRRTLCGEYKRVVKYGKDFTSIPPEWDAWLRRLTSEPPRDCKKHKAFAHVKHSVVCDSYKRWVP